MAGLNVMIVDDSVLAVRKVEAMLVEMGHRVVGTASTGAEAISAYKKCMPDLVTMDITMPDMDGIQATKAIIAAFPDARIIMATSHGQENMVRDAIRAGAKGYVLKPVKAEKLLASIDKALKE